jgi:hypothetical protein
MGWMICGSIPSREKRLFFLPQVDTSSVAHPAYNIIIIIIIIIGRSS